MVLCKACQKIFLADRKDECARLSSTTSEADYGWRDEMDADNKSESKSLNDEDTTRSGMVESEIRDGTALNDKFEADHGSEGKVELSNESESNAINNAERSAAQKRAFPDVESSMLKKRLHCELTSDEEASAISTVQSPRPYTPGDRISPSQKEKEKEKEARGIEGSEKEESEEDESEEDESEEGETEDEGTEDEESEEGRSEEETVPKGDSTASGQWFVNNPRKDWEISRYRHHKSSAAFLDAANKGCQLCLMLLAQFSEEDRAALDQQYLEMEDEMFPYDVPYDDITTYAITGEVGHGVDERITSAEWTISARCIISSNRSGIRTVNSKVAFVTAKEQAALSNLEASTSVGSDNTAVPLVKDWLTTCDKYHEHCSSRFLSSGQNSKTTGVANGPQPLKSMNPDVLYQSHQNGPLAYPSLFTPRKFARIIDVRPTHNPSKPRLCQVEDVPTDALYMTLSHCWGGVQPLKLTVANHEAMKACIPYRELPKYFRQAIRFTRKLEVRFLWIDSLCIIQDSTEDWLEQSVVMGEIYMGSYCNIAATAALDGNGGLFGRRNSHSIQPLRVFLPYPGKVVPILNRPGTDQYYDAIDTKMWQREVSESRLCQRGWVVQERALTRRSLHFGKRQLYWECSEISACETFVEGLERLLRATTDDLPFKFHDPLRQDLPTTLSSFEHGAHQHPPSFFTVWGRLVEVYTAAGLTFDKDKLVAISGLAMVMAARANIRYLAGLWDYKLPNQLLWHTLKPEARPKDYRAPSWSWASINSAVIPWVQALHRVRICVVDVQITTSERHSFSQIHSGHLRIRGDLIPGELNSQRSRNARNRSLLGHCLSLRGEKFGHGIFEDGECDIGIYLDAHEENCGPVLCVPIEFYCRVSGQDIIIQNGLILKATSEEGVFRRIGIFKMVYPIDYKSATSRNIRLMDPKRSPSTIDPKSRIEKKYRSYIHVEDADGKSQKMGPENLLGNFVFDIV